MTWRLRDVSIQQKLTLLFMAAATVALLVFAGAVFGIELVQFRATLERDVATQSELVRAMVVPALTFRDEAAANESLAALRMRPNLIAAWLLRAGDTNIFARYTRPGESPAPPVSSTPLGTRFEGGSVFHVEPIFADRDVVGTLILQADAREARERLWTYAYIVLPLLASALLLSLPVASRLQRLVSQPLLDLAATTQSVSTKGDYSVRARKQSSDEIGTLVDGFNEMLAQIQKRDDALRASEERFREMADSIRQVFWLSDVAKECMVYVSPAYEEIWGRTCASLYQDPKGWVEALHPEDRERVWKAAREKQVRGEYDQVYRIIRPDGSERWIRDRAFPVRDAEGRVHRVAGVAEDITERKQLEQEVIEISDREQARIGQDIHDELCQHLVSTGLAAGLLAQTLRERGAAEAAAAEEIVHLVKNAITEAYGLVGGLFPARLPAEGLASALQELMHRLSLRHDIHFELDYPQPVTVSPAEATHLFRIAQEALNNAVKHARATRLKISLYEPDGCDVMLTIKDNGVGLPADAGGARGFGVHFMRYRAGMIGATLDLHAGPDGGTILTCSIPRRS